MDTAVWAFIGTLAGAAIGATASIATTTVSGWNAFRLQRGANSLERIERARAFQRDNLLEVQDALQNSMRLMGRAHFEDEVAYRECGNWGKQMLSDDVNENILLSNRRMFALVERIADDSLRAELKDIRQKITSVLMARSEVDASIFINEASTAYTAVMEHLGRVLRNHY